MSARVAGPAIATAATATAATATTATATTLLSKTHAQAGARLLYARFGPIALHAVPFA
jgi:hypothetical protein